MRVPAPPSPSSSNRSPATGMSLVVDSTDVKRVSARGLLAVLNPADFPVADIPEAVWAPELHEIDGALRAVPEKFGYNGIAFDKNVFSDDQARSSATLFDPSNKEKIAIYDYYLPIITKIAISGCKIRRRSPRLICLQSRRAFCTEGELCARRRGGELADGAATGEVGMVVGGGEYTVSACTPRSRISTGNLLDEGDVRWHKRSLCLRARPKGGGDEVPQYIVSPEGQARLATSSCTGRCLPTEGDPHGRAEEGAALGRSSRNLLPNRTSTSRPLTNSIRHSSRSGRSFCSTSRSAGRYRSPCRRPIYGR